MWRSRDLLLLLTRRELSGRYRQSLLGVGWAVIRPLISMVVFTLIFGKAGGFEDKVPIAYPVFAFLGLVPWLFFATSLTGVTASVVTGQSMLTKVYFPRLVLPLSAIAIGAVEMCIQLTIVAGMMLAFGIAPTSAAVLLPAFVLMAAVTAFAVGIWLTALNVKYRDVGQAIPFLVQVWMYCSPVIYPASMIPERWQWLYYLNPMAGVIVGFRWAAAGMTPPHWGSVGISFAVTLVLLVGGLAYFRKTENTFADVV